MANRQNEERARIRAARYAPGRGFYEGIEMTLHSLPRRKQMTLKNKVLAASSVAATLALLLIFTAPQIVRAAAQLYQRLFGQVVLDIKAEQAQPEDEKLKAMIAGYERWAHWHYVEGVSTEIEGVTVSVSSVRTMPADMGDENSVKGQLDLTLTYSKIPPFDPSRVDFSLVVDGKEIPMRVDEQLKDYRDRDGHTVTEVEWADGWTSSNSELRNGVPTTTLWFDVDDWKWEQPRQLEVKAVIDAQPLLIPFTFDPVKAHEQAVEDAKVSVALGEENYQHEKDSLESMEANAVPVGLSGSADGYDWAIPEMSYANEKLYFTAAFGGIKERNPKIVGMNFWAGGVTVDGMGTGPESSDNDELKDGTYTAIYETPLARDPRKLPEESLINLTLELGGSEQSQDVAFKYNWKEKKATLPKDEAEMQAWVEQAYVLTEALHSQYAADIGYDLTPLHLTREKDGVSATLAAVNFSAETGSLEFYLEYQGDVEASVYNWMQSPNTTINGYRCYEGNGQFEGEITRSKFDVCPPLNISEFGNGDRVVFEFPLYGKDAYDGTNYPEPVDTLRYEFTIDKNVLKPLTAD